MVKVIIRLIRLGNLLKQNVIVIIRLMLSHFVKLYLKNHITFQKKIGLFFCRVVNLCAKKIVN
jgi:hypothetical protein